MCSLCFKLKHSSHWATFSLFIRMTGTEPAKTTNCKKLTA